MPSTFIRSVVVLALYWSSTQAIVDLGDNEVSEPPVSPAGASPNGEWVVVWSKGQYGEVDLGENVTNALFAESGVFRRRCSSCWNADYKEIYYQRITSIPTGFSIYSNMKNNWFSVNNLLHRDFELYGSYGDMLMHQNSWNVCNYDDPGTGFPRDCGRNFIVWYQWNGIGRGQTDISFEVLTEPLPGFQFVPLPSVQPDSYTVCQDVPGYTLTKDRIHWGDQLGYRMQKSDIAALAAYCNELANCAGFDHEGYLKTTTVLDGTLLGNCFYAKEPCTDKASHLVQDHTKVQVRCRSRSLRAFLQSNNCQLDTTCGLWTCPELSTADIQANC